MSRSIGKWKLPQPTDIKEENEWVQIPRIARTVPFGYKQNEEDPDILASIEAPTLVIHGREDNIIPYESSFIFQEYIKDIELKIYPNTGHLPMYEAPEKIANDIKKFIEFRF